MGARWVGTLTYLDYSKNKSVSIRSDLIVTEVPDHPASLEFSYLYPDEPKANSKTTISIKNNGASLGDETLVSNTRIDTTTLKIITTNAGQDNNRTAQFRFTYVLNARAFSILKEVRVEGSAD